MKDISTNVIHNDYMFVKKKGIAKIALHSLKYIISAMHNNYNLYASFFQIVKIS